MKMKSGEWFWEKRREREGFREGNFGKLIEPINTLSLCAGLMLIAGCFQIFFAPQIVILQEPSLALETHPIFRESQARGKVLAE